VQSREDGKLFPICANRFPDGEYRVPAKAVRFENGRLVVGAAGMLVSQKTAADATLHFEARQGALEWHDTVLMDVHPALDAQGVVVGTGLDNSLGVLTVLLTALATVYSFVDPMLEDINRRCLFVFVDQEEGPPDGFFGHGAARLTYAVPPPTLGCVVVDAQTAGPGLVPQVGRGVSHSAASNWGRGSIVPPNYHALAVDLARDLNAAHPGTVQLNTGYLSRSDDMILGRWAPILALSGPPMADAHTGHESAQIADIQRGARWLTHFLAAVLGVAPDLDARYGLAGITDK
jgi:putative aminopeptidase FrvX